MFDGIALTLGYWLMTVLAVLAAGTVSVLLLKALSELGMAASEAAEENAVNLGAYIYSVTWLRMKIGDVEEFERSLTSGGYRMHVSVKEVENDE